MNMPYKTSRDYQLLKKLLDEGKEKADIPLLAVVVNMLHFGKITITNGRLKMKCEWLI